MTGTDLARASRELRPYKHGDLDGLCGLYAIINALRVSAYPDRIISNRVSRQRLESGLRLLGGNRKLRDAVVHGIDYALWLAMCHAVIAEAEMLLGTCMTIKPLLGDDSPGARATSAGEFGINCVAIVPWCSASKGGSNIGQSSSAILDNWHRNA